MSAGWISEKWLENGFSGEPIIRPLNSGLRAWDLRSIAFEWGTPIDGCAAPMKCWRSNIYIFLRWANNGAFLVKGVRRQQWAPRSPGGWGD